VLDHRGVIRGKDLHVGHRGGVRYRDQSAPHRGKEGKAASPGSLAQAGPHAVGPIAKGAKKNSCCATTRGRNCRFLDGLGHDFGLPPALLFGLGMLFLDVAVPTAFSLAASILPAADFRHAFRVLAVALVPASWLVLASASLAKASPRARSPCSGQTPVSVSTVEGAHGSGNSHGKARGECRFHSPRALLKLEEDAYPPVYRLLENKTGRQTVSSARREQEPPSAAHQTIFFSRTGCSLAVMKLGRVQRCSARSSQGRRGAGSNPGRIYTT
jgi:hypothetical protein